MANEWKPIGPDEALYDGDVIRLTFTVSGFTYLTAAQIALVERKLDKDKRFHILRHSIPETEGKFQLTEFTMDVEVDTPGVSGEWFQSQLVVAGTLTAAKIASIIIGAFIGIVIMIALKDAVKLVQAVGESKEAIAETGWASLKIAAAIISILAAWKYL